MAMRADIIAMQFARVLCDIVLRRRSNAFGVDFELQNLGLVKGLVAVQARVSDSIFRNA
jgi:hypothetical protein